MNQTRKEKNKNRNAARPTAAIAYNLLGPFVVFRFAFSFIKSLRWNVACLRLNSTWSIWQSFFFAFISPDVFVAVHDNSTSSLIWITWKQIHRSNVEETDRSTAAIKKIIQNRKQHFCKAIENRNDHTRGLHTSGNLLCQKTGLPEKTEIFISFSPNEKRVRSTNRIP